ncbi:hypothetical protein R6Q57_020621 [Mikania cordata]
MKDDVAAIKAQTDEKEPEDAPQDPLTYLVMEVNNDGSPVSGVVKVLESDALELPEVAGASSANSKVQILMPGCGNSPLSEQLYNAGFRCIPKIDFLKVVIGDMLKRDVCSRPCMRWRVMDKSFALTSQIIVDNVVYDKVDSQLGQPSFSNDHVFRRLTFERLEGLTQSEGIQTSEGSQKKIGANWKEMFIKFTHH